MTTDRIVRCWLDETRSERYRALGIWGDQTLVEIFDKCTADSPDKTAVIDTHVRWTYEQLRDRTLRAAQLLLDWGIRPGDAVAVQLPSCALLPLIHLAANRIGALMVAMPARWREREVAGLVDSVGASLLISVESDGDVEVRSVHEAVRPQLPQLRSVHYARTTGPDSFESLLAGAEPISPAAQASLRPHPDAPAHVMCSSGTTGVPKASVWGGNDMVAFLLHQTTEALHLSSDDIAAGIAPAGQASTGYVFPILAPLLIGGTSVILERWSPAAALDLIVNERCTYATAIPTQMAMMLELPLESADLSAFSRFNNAGAPLPPHVAEEIEERMGCRVQNVYGTTDGGVPTMTAVDDPATARFHTVGRVCVGEEVELRGTDGHPVEPGEAGEICWRGANNSYGYFNQPDYDSATWLDDGWCRSGDLGQFDDEGYLRIVGRIKDMILRGGMNVFPAEIEEALANHPRVRTAAIVPVPDERLGERACAVVVATGAAPTLEELTTFLTTKGFAKYKLPEFLVLLEELPINAGGKVDKTRLTDLVTGQLEGVK